MPRRTQAERRETTIAAIVEATIAALDEVGYGRTTVQQIATRAGVSVGAIFRHFPTRLDVIVEAAEEVGRRQVGEFLRLVSERSADGDLPPVRQVLEIFQTIARAPLGTVWDELGLHARTDPELRERIVPTLEGLMEAIDAVIDGFPALADRAPAERKALRNLVLAAYSNQDRFRMADDDPCLPAATVDLLERVAHALGID